MSDCEGPFVVRLGRGSVDWFFVTRNTLCYERVADQA